MTVSRDIIKLMSKDPFAHQPFGPDITRFERVSQTTSQAPALPLVCLRTMTGWSDHRDPTDSFGSVCSPDESDQLSRQVEVWCAGDAQLEYIEKVAKILRQNS
jgi:hypothetical protein